MKKIFYFLASAIVALGAMACQNEVDENITPENTNEITFNVSFDESTRIAMGELADGKLPFVFDGKGVAESKTDSLYVGYSIFDGESYVTKRAALTNTEAAPLTFTADQENMSILNELVGEPNVYAVNKYTETVDSDKSASGLLFRSEIFEVVAGENNITLSLACPALYFTVPTGTEVALSVKNESREATLLFNNEEGPISELTFGEGTHIVGINTKYYNDAIISYSIGGEVMKEKLLTDLTNKVYNLGTLGTVMTIADVAALIAESDEITLPAGATITGSEILTINKNITINGNGATFTSTAARAINIETTGEVNISNLTVECSGERVFNIINKPATVNISDVTATASNYAIMVATSAGAATVNVENSTLTGLNVVNIAGKGAQVTIDKCVLNCEDNNPNESYGALALYNTADDASIVATECDINVAGDSYKAWNSSKTGTITISDGEVVNAIAYIDYNNGYSYSFSSLAEAIKTAKGDDVIVLLDDAVIAQEGEFKIDLNGHKLTAPEGYIATKDGENIKVVELGEAIENWGIVGDHQGWDTANTNEMFLIPDTKTYVRRNVTLGDGFKFYGKTTKIVIEEHPAVTTGEEGDYYLKPSSNWKEGNARFAIYFFKDGGDTAWVSMKDDNGDGIYVADKPDGDFDKMIFCRMDPNNKTNDWTSGAKWNQTGDLTCPTNGNNCFTVPSGIWDGATTAWSVHVPEIKDAWTEEVEQVTTYWIGKENSDVITTWVTRWSNNGGEYNITVADTDKTYDIYFSKGDDQDWGFEVKYIVVESGTVLDTLIK